MKIEIAGSFTDEGGQVYYVVRDDVVDALYERDRDWWRNRTRDQTPEVVRRIIDQQARDYDSNPKRELGAALNAIVRDRTGKTRTNKLSVLEIGCVNGMTVRHLNKHFPDIALSFSGFEVNGDLVGDFRRHFPQHDVIQGGVEEFLEKDVSAFPHWPYDLFLAVGTLCMVKPNMVLEVLRKASQLTDRIVFWDYLENRGGQISKDRPVMFHLPNGPHVLYAHPFERFLKTIGFGIDVLEFIPPEARTHAARTGIVVASRPAAKARRKRRPK